MGHEAGTSLSTSPRATGKRDGFVSAEKTTGIGREVNSKLADGHDHRGVRSRDPIDHEIRKIKIRRSELEFARTPPGHTNTKADFEG